MSVSMSILFHSGSHFLQFPFFFVSPVLGLALQKYYMSCMPPLSGMPTRPAKLQVLVQISSLDDADIAIAIAVCTKSSVKADKTCH